MTTTAKAPIAKLRFREPVRNLPSHRQNGGTERLFCLKFARAYRDQFRALHGNTNKDQFAIAREIPANGYGIADIVALNWKSSKDQESVSVHVFFRRRRPVVRAFEVKVRDWRKGLLQANRYRFFAHVPILVIHSAFADQAAAYLQTFRLLKVGLWSFEPLTNTVTRIYTPRQKRPSDLSQHIKVIEKVGKANRPSKALPVF